MNDLLQNVDLKDLCKSLNALFVLADSLQAAKDVEPDFDFEELKQAVRSMSEEEFKAHIWINGMIIYSMC